MSTFLFSLSTLCLCACSVEHTVSIEEGAIGSTSSVTATPLNPALLSDSIFEIPVGTGKKQSFEAVCDAVEIEFVLPQHSSFYTRHNDISTVVHVTGIEDFQDLHIAFENDSGTVITEVPINEYGLAQYVGKELSKHIGSQEIVARLISSQGSCTTTVSQPLVVCIDLLVEDFEMAPTGWQAVGDAVWNSSGWIDLTENEQARQGAFFFDTPLQSGDTSIHMTIQTGNGMNGGADGLALTIIDVPNATQLPELLTEAEPGGGIGYAVSEDPGLWNGRAITIEIDTFQNTGDYEHIDPTTSDHIGIIENADPEAHVAWVDTPTIADFELHDVQVTLVDGMATIYVDGVEYLRQSVDLEHVGGYLVLSGSTGWATNQHRVHDLEVYHGCGE